MASEDEFARFRDRYEETMERMFGSVSALYAEHWGDFFHFAIFEDGTDDRVTAFEHTHRRYADALGVADATNVLELACGRGGFTDFLAARTAGRVLGIDISHAQLSHAARYRRPNLRFQRHDIMRVDELPGRFDAVACIDAEPYLPDKRAAVERIAGVMSPGARFLLIAWCRRDGLKQVQQELVLHPLMRSWGIAGFETARGYRKYLRDAGLNLLDEIDLNEKVRSNWDLGYRRAIEAVDEFSLARAAQLLWKGMPLGAEGVQLIREQFAAALYIKAAFDAGFLRYTYFLAEKS